MSLPLRSSPEEGALPPGLAGEAAALVEPGEGFLWVGRGRSGATFAALWPVAVVPAILLAVLLWLWLGFDPRSLPADSTVRVEGSGEFAVALFGAGCLWILLQFAHRVAAAPRTLFVLTAGRLIVKAGRRRLTYPLADIDYAAVGGTASRRSLAFQTLRGKGGRSGPRPTLFGAANVDSAIPLLERLGIAVRDERPDLEEPDEGPAGVEPGEIIVWSGRRGLRAIGPSRLMIAIACAPLPLPLFGALWFIWSTMGEVSGSTGAAIGAGGFMSFIACMILGPMAWLPLSRAPGFFGEIFVDTFGSLAVTDRRILFTGPLTGRVHRDVPAERLVDATLVLLDERGRGHISLTLKPESGEKLEYMELYAVPDPENAVVAMARLSPLS